MGNASSKVRGPSRPLVGRGSELQQIADALAEPSTSGVVLIGPGGVGKTHLARHALATAAASGFATAEILATKAASSIPLGALEPILGEEYQAGSVGVLRSAQARMRELAAGGPLVLFVDDAHLLDDASATLVLLLAADDNVFIVATVRTGEAVPDPVTALWKDAAARRIDLAPLTLEGTETLVRRLVGGPVTLPALARLIELSRGLPMTVCELVDAARRSSALVERDGLWHLDGALPVSDRLTDLVNARLNDCSEGEREALATIALGDPLPLATATEIVGADALASLERRELIVVHPATGDVSVGHPLYGEVAVSGLGELRRRTLVTTLADSMSASAAPGPSIDLRVAIWRLTAGGDVDGDTLLRGAEAAYRAGDHTTTATLAGAAWERDPTPRSGHLHGLALSRMGRSAEAETVLAAATGSVVDGADGDKYRVLVTLARSENLFRGCNDAAGAIQCVTDAESGTVGSSWRDELVGHRAMMLLNLNKVDTALELTRPILEPFLDADVAQNSAQDHQAERPFVRAAYAAGIAANYAGRCEYAAEVAQRALPVHERLWKSDLYQTEPAVHHISAMLSLIERGDLHGAEAYSDIAVQVAAETGESYGLGYMSMIAGLVAMRRGRMETARKRCLDAVPLFRATGYVAQSRWSLAGAATCAVALDDPDAARGYLATVDALRPATPMLLNESRIEEARAWILVADGQYRQARELLAESAAAARCDGALGAAAHLLHTLGRLGEPAAALEGLQTLQAIDGPLHQLRIDHVRALIDDDGPALDAVAAGFGECGADLFAAEAASGATRAYRRDGDQRAATRAAHAMAAHTAACEGASTPAMVIADTVDPLTDREREVAMLAADGLTSKQIAERLILSRRTVDNHLQKVFAKLGISRRADLRDALRH